MSVFAAILCGVGGQGIVMMSRVLGTACVRAGMGVVTGEQHGLSQRSGSVSIHIRIGDGVESPLIPVGTADAIVTLEALEALRYVEYLRPGGTVLSSRLVMHPVTETAAMPSTRRYDCFGIEEAGERLRRIAGRVDLLPARETAESLGSPIYENMYMLGALTALGGFPLEAAHVLGVVESLSPGGHAAANAEAFRLGGSHTVEAASGG